MTVDPEIFRHELSIADVFPDATREEWLRLAVDSLKGASSDELESITHEGITIKPLYTADDAADLPAVDADLHTSNDRPWRVCPRYCHPDPVVVSKRLAEDAGRGAGAAWIFFDRCVRMGLDTDDAAGWVGPCDGTIAVGADEIAAMLDGVDPTRTAIHLSGGGNGIAVAAATIAAARRLGLALDYRLDVDPLAALVADGVLPFGLEQSLSLLPDIASWTVLNAPGSRSLAASTLPYHLAGACAVQELAYGVATAVEYLRRMTLGGVELDPAVGQLRFVFAIGRDLFMEIAKLRAARRLWARIVEACGASAKTAPTEVHALTSPRCLTVRDPWVNLLRTTTQSCAAVIGGADRLTVLPFDAAAGPPDDLARRLATNTQTILREESHLHRVADPTAGSWYVERLTEDLAEGAWARFQQIEAVGGMAAAVTSGVIHREMEDARASRRHAIATRHDLVTGVSAFPYLDEQPLSRQAPDVLALRGSIRESLSGRSSPSAELDRLRMAADSESREGTVTVAAIDALAAGATLAEVADTLRGGGEPTRCEALPQERESEIFERLRDAGDAWLAETGRRPRVFLAAVGPPAEHRQIREFTVNLLAAGGIETVSTKEVDDLGAIASEFESSATRTAVIVANPKRSGDVVPELASALKEQGALRVLVAARPGETEGAWRAAGVDGFLCEGCDVRRTLHDVLAASGWLP